MCVIRQKLDRLDFDTFMCMILLLLIAINHRGFLSEIRDFQKLHFIGQIITVCANGLWPQRQDLDLSSRENGKASFDHGQSRTLVAVLSEMCLFIVEIN